MPPRPPRLGSDDLRPDWWGLWNLAHAQAGHFTAQDARESRVSTALLSQNVGAGVVLRVERGIYRFAQFPPHPQEDLAVRWLWTDREGVFSHETALLLHRLSDALPNITVMTVPAAWARRRLTIPRGVELHFDDVVDADVQWVDAVPVTTPLRTVIDCWRVGVSPELVNAAVREAIARGLFSRARYTRALGREHPHRGTRKNRR